MHLWSTCIPPLFSVRVGCVGGSSVTILLLLAQIVRNLAVATSFVLVCVRIGELATVSRYCFFVQHPETEDPQLVAQPRVGRNHGEAMGRS